MDRRSIREVSLGFLSCIFIFNDLLFMRAQGWGAWLLIDYGSRLLALAVLLGLIRTGFADRRDLGLVLPGLRTGIAWALLLTAAGVLIDQIAWRFFEGILPGIRTSPYPAIEDQFMRVFDLTAGTMLISLSEEAVFRGYFNAVVKERVRSGTQVLILSCIVFGAIHWSQGLHAVISTALWGILPMVALQRTGTIVPAMVAHYVTDLVSLSGVVPEGWFGFLR